MSDNKKLFYSDDEDDVQYNQTKKAIKNLQQPADVSVLVKTAHVSLPVPVFETKSKDCSSQKAIAF